MVHRQHPDRRQRDRRGWYTLSLETVRAWAIALAALALVGVGYLVHHEWLAYAEQREADALITEAEGLLERLSTSASLDRFRAEYTAAGDHVIEARRAYERGEFAAARRSGFLARNVLLAILSSLERRGDVGEASFITVQGDVEYRRGESGTWQPARSRVALASGDYVRTGANGSAEIVFADSTLYTVRPSTSFIVSRTPGGDGGDERSITMEYGWVNLNTASRATRVATPDAEARVQEDSEAFVSYERESREGRIGAVRGAVEVVAGDVKRQLTALQEVVQVGDRLSETRRLPAPPDLIEPQDNLQVDFDRVRKLVLAWRPVAGASRYALQVSRNHLFSENVIDVQDRSTTRATLGVRGGGNFHWQVRAIGRDGTLGPWSQARKFRVAAATPVRRSGGGEVGGDEVPPELDLDDVGSYGNIFIVAGRTEPGALVEVGGEAVKVAADGSFTKTIQLNKQGWSFIEIRARDAWGNETTRRQRVFVDLP